MKRLAVLIAAMAVFSLLAGCWDRLEIEERAVVLAIAIDVADKEEVGKYSRLKRTSNKYDQDVDFPEGKEVRLTAQIAVPGRIPLGPGQGTGSDQSPVWILEALGHTIDEALQSMQLEVADRLFFGHLRVIVMSEAYARRGTGNMSDFLRRNSEVRRQAWLLVSKEPADLFMKTAPQLEDVPALYLLSTLDHAVQMGKYPQAPIGSFWTKLSSLGQEATLPYFEIQDEVNVRLAGLAYFLGEQLAGVTNSTEIGLFMGLTGSERGGYSSFVRIPDTDETAMFQVTNRDTEARVRMQNGRPHIDVRMVMEGNIAESSDQDRSNLDSQRELDKIKRDLSDRYSRRYEQFIREMQAEGCDIFGYGEYVRAHEPAYWNRHVRTKERWQRLFQEIDVSVDASFNVRRVGMKAQ